MALTHIVGQVVEFYECFARKYGRALYYVFKLADVPGPIVTREYRLNRPRYAGYVLVCPLIEVLQKDPRKKRDVVFPVPKGRHVQGQRREPEKQVFPKPSFSHLGFEVPVRRGYNPAPCLKLLIRA